MSYDDIHRENRDALVEKNKAFLVDKVFLEFGVCRGTSMAMWLEAYSKNEVPEHFLGFDSFQGLPEETEDENSIWHTGEFSTGGVIPTHLTQGRNVKFVEGFYEDSLTDDAVALLEGKKVGLIHMDCDTYSSTKTVWEWLIKHDLLAKGALVVYDDWGCYLEADCGEYEIGEAKAHAEIEKTHDLSFVELGRYIVDPKFYEVTIFRYV